MATYTRVLLLTMATLIIVGKINYSLAQNCGCSKGLCCSRWGFCGTTQLHCGGGCQEGPCTLNSTASPALPATVGSIHSEITKTISNRINSGISAGSIESIIAQIFFDHIISGISAGSIKYIITQTFFNNIKSGISASCEGYNFYTYNGFIDAAKAKISQVLATPEILLFARESSLLSLPTSPMRPGVCAMWKKLQKLPTANLPHDGPVPLESNTTDGGLFS